MLSLSVGLRGASVCGISLSLFLLLQKRTNAFDMYLVRLLAVVWWLFLRILTHAGHHD